MRVLSSSPLLCLAFSCIVRAACVSRDLGVAAQCLELFVRVAAMGRTDGRMEKCTKTMSSLKKKGLKAAKSFGWRINSQRGEQLRKYFQNASMFVTIFLFFFPS